MKLSVTKYEYKRTKIDDFEISIPDETVVYQAYNHKILTLISPEYTTWLKKEGKEEEIFRLNVIILNVDESIKKLHLSLDKRTIEFLLAPNMDNMKGDELEKRKILQILIDYPNDDKTTLDKFHEYYSSTISKFKEIIT